MKASSPTPHAPKRRRPLTRAELHAGGIASFALAAGLVTACSGVATEAARAGGGAADAYTDSSSVSSGSGSTQPEPSPSELIARALTFDLPEPTVAEPQKLWATFYYVPEANSDASGFALRDMRGRSLGAALSRRDWCEAAMQGTVAIGGDDGALTFNYAGTKKNTEVDCTSIYPKHPAIGRTRFTRAVGPYGDGVRGMILIPLRTIATDPKVIPFGSLVYVPAARGTKVTLPDGQTATHDGYFFAGDRGGAIRHEHIDVFVGLGKKNPFAFVKSRSSGTFEAQVVAADDAPAAHRRLREAHRAFTGR